MKKLTIIAIFCLSLLSCDNKPIKSISTVKAEGNYIETSSFTREEVKEFEYKGHTYIYTRVREGISSTHAGHCTADKK